MLRNHEDEEATDPQHATVVSDGLANVGDQEPASLAKVTVAQWHDVKPARDFATADHNIRPATETEADEARLAEINKNLDLAQRPYLELADMVRVAFILVARLRFGQNVQTSGPDRDRIVSRMASEMAIPGRSDGAKRKWLERILKVANISPEAKVEAQRAGVAKFQSALLEIASAGDESAQLQKVAEIVVLNADRKAERKVRTAGPKFLKAVIRYEADRKDEVLQRLASFVEQLGIQLDP